MSLAPTRCPTVPPPLPPRPHHCCHHLPHHRTLQQPPPLPSPRITPPNFTTTHRCYHHSNTTIYTTTFISLFLSLDLWLTTIRGCLFGIDSIEGGVAVTVHSNKEEGGVHLRGVFVCGTSATIRVFVWGGRQQGRGGVPFRPSVTPVEHTILAVNLKIATLKSSGHGNNRNRKACFLCKSFTHLIKECDYYEKKMVQKPVRNHAIRGNHQHYATMTHPNPQSHVVPIAVLTRSRLVPLNAARPVHTAVPHTKVHHQRPVPHGVHKPHLPLRSYGFGPKETLTFLFYVQGNPQHALKDKGVIDSGCSRHMTENMSYLTYFEEINSGYVAFGRNPKGGKITGKGKIRTGKLDFDDVHFVKELKFNLFSISHICDKKNNVLFTYTECIVLSSDFMLPDENHVLLRVPRENNMYNVDLKNIVPLGDLICLFAKATLDESNLWHRRLGHINFKTMNKLVKGNLVRGLPSKVFENNHTCVACKKGKQHRAFDLNQFCGMKGMKREFSVARTPQQNGIAKRKNRTLIEAARTMLADSLLPIPFWAEAFNTACIQEHFNVEKAGEGNVQQYVLFLLWSFGSKDPQNTDDDTTFEVKDPESAVHVSPSSSAKAKKHDDKTKREAKGKNMPALEDITYSNDEEDVGAEAGFSNLETSIPVSPILTTRVHKGHPVTQIIGDLSSAPQTRSMKRMVKEQGILVPQQAADDVANVVADDVDDVAVEDAAEPTLPSPTPTTITPPPQEFLPSTSQDKIAQALEITKLKQRVRRLEKKNKLKVYGLRRLKKYCCSQCCKKKKEVVIKDPEETATPSTIMHYEPKSKDKGKGILVEEPKPLKKQAHIEQDEAYARELEAELNKNRNWDVVIEQHFNSVVGFLEKSKKELEEEASKALKRKTKNFKEYTLRYYYCWLKTYCCWYKLKLLDDAADIKLRLLEQSVAADDKMKK
nr:ribonuclease H-like domain-containing protein [Tanacetum cinerariifolium]